MMVLSGPAEAFAPAKTVVMMVSRAWQGPLLAVTMNWVERFTRSRGCGCAGWSAEGAGVQLYEVAALCIRGRKLAPSQIRVSEGKATTLRLFCKAMLADALAEQLPLCAVTV